MKDIETLELRISKFLRAGVFLSAFFLLIGFIIQFRWSKNVFYVFDTYDQIPFQNQLRFHLYHRHWGPLFSYVGLITLISLPVIRVFLTGVIFLKQKENILAYIAFVVLLGLLISFTFGIEL